MEEEEIEGRAADQKRQPQSLETRAVALPSLMDCPFSHYPPCRVLNRLPSSPSMVSTAEPSKGFTCLEAASLWPRWPATLGAKGRV